MARKGGEKNYSFLQEGGKKVNSEELKLQKSLILQIFKDVDKLDQVNGRIPRNFNPIYGEFVGNSCSGLPFSLLLKVFYKRYGITPNSPAQQQLQQHHVNSVDDDNDNHNCPDLDCDVVEEILRRFCLPSLMMARSICKAWNTTISSGTFKQCMNVEGTYHFTTHHIVDGFHGIAFFSSALNRWFRIPVLWKRWTWHHTMRYRYHPHPTQLYLCAGAAGLYLFVHWDQFFNRHLVIFNPLTKLCKVLPPLPLPCCWGTETAVELIAQSGNGHFQIITIGFKNNAPGYLCPLLYNSTTDKWRDVSTTRAVHISNFSQTHRWTSAICNGVVYFTSNFGHHLCCYDIARGEFEFKEIEGGLAPQMDYFDCNKNRCASLPSLVACNGKLLLVGRLQKKVSEEPIFGRFPFMEHTLVGIWELQNNKRWFWSLISVTPRDLLQDTVKSSDGTDIMVSAASDKIWLTIKGSLNLMNLDLSCMEWSIFPGCPPEDLTDNSPRKAVCGTFSLS